MSFGTCTVTINNLTGVELTFDKAKSKIEGVLSTSSPTSVPAKASRVYKIIPTVGNTKSAGKLYFKVNAAVALVVDATCKPPIVGLEADSKLAAVSVIADSSATPENSLVGTVAVSQATGDSAASEAILAEAEEKAE